MNRIGLLLIFFLALTSAQTQDIKDQLCKTWVAYKETESDPMRQRQFDRDIFKIGGDTLILKQNNSIIRHTQNKVLNGTWQLTSDKDYVEFGFPNYSADLYPYSTERIIIKTLTDTTLQLTFAIGKEGEHVTRFFKAIRQN